MALVLQSARVIVVRVTFRCEMQSSVIIKWKTQRFSYECVDFSSPNGVAHLKNQLSLSTGVDPANQKLIFGSRTLNDGDSLEKSEVTNGSVLQMLGNPRPVGGGAVRPEILPATTASDSDSSAAVTSNSDNDNSDLIRNIMARLIESESFARLVDVVFDLQGESAQCDDSSPCQGGAVTPKEQRQCFFASLLVRAAALRWPIFALSEIQKRTMLPIFSERCDVTAERHNFMEYLLEGTSGSVTIACGDFVERIWNESIPLEGNHNFGDAKSTDAMLARQIYDIALELQSAARLQLDRLKLLFPGPCPNTEPRPDDFPAPSEESVASDGIDPEDFENVRACRHYLPRLCAR